MVLAKKQGSVNSFEELRTALDCLTRLLGVVTPPLEDREHKDEVREVQLQEDAPDSISDHEEMMMKRK